MQLKINPPGDAVLEVIKTEGLAVTGYVTLLELPPDFAATKKYVDNLFSGLDISQQTFDIPAASVVSRFSGDLVGYSGNNVRLVDRVVAGTYPAVTVNTKGLVTLGGGITSNEMPFIPWSKIQLDAQTLDHGITDALVTTGGSFTGNLTLNAEPSSALHAVTKAYVDTAALNSGKGGIEVGDLMLKQSGKSYAGFLVCNGAELSRTTYASLYAVLGDTYSIAVEEGVRPGTGQPWREQYDFNFKQTADITPWATGTALPATINNSQAIVTRSRVYLLGGLINGGWSAVVYTAPINADGTLGTWTTTTSLPATLGYSQAVLISGSSTGTARVYILGGQIAGSVSPTIYSAPVNTDGTLGTWIVSGTLPVSITYSQAVVTTTRVYLIGGLHNSAASSSVYSAPINPDGSLGIWVAGTSLPLSVTYSQAFVTKNRVYVLGGQINGSLSAVVYTALIAADGTLGAWTTGTSLPATSAYSQVVCTKTKAYLLGGQFAGTNSAATYNAPINTDGT